MKFKKITIMLILLVFAVSCVSAAENATSLSDSQQTILENTTPEASGDEQIAGQINVTFDEKVYEKNLTNITVSLPEGCNGTLDVKIDDYTIYNATVNGSTVTVPIQIPPMKYPYAIINIWPQFDYTFHGVTAYYNGVEINVTHPLLIMKYPRDHSPVFMIPQEVLQYGQRYSFMPAMMFPRSARGTVEIYLDGKLLNSTNVTGPFVYIDEEAITSLDLGPHRLAANYSGDDYYEAKNVTWDFNVTDVVISIPKNVYLDHDDCVSVSVSNRSRGTVSIYIDSKLVKRESLDDNGEFLHTLFNDITCGEHEITVTVECDTFNRTKTVRANTTYSIDLYSLYSFRYGEKNIIYVYIPLDMRADLFNVTVNGIRMPVEKKDQDLMIDVSILDVTNYTVTVSYLGDDKYYPKTVTGNFSVSYGIYFYDSDIYYGYGSEVRLNLPANARGNLSAYIDGVIYRTVSLDYGKASFKISDLNPGVYRIDLIYTGSDYEVENISTTITSNPSMKYESVIEVGSKNILEFRVPKDCKGRIYAVINNRIYSATIVNGLARLDLSSLPVGDWDFDVFYMGEDGYNESYFAGVFVEYAPVKITSAVNTIVAYALGTYKVRAIGADGKIAKNAKVIFKINGRTVKTVRTNAYGWAILKVPATYGAGKYTITAQYGTAKVSRSLTVRHIVALSAVKVKKSAKKLILTAKVNKAFRGKVVTFTFAGKTLRAKINSYGFARAIVTKSTLGKLKVGQKVIYRATFLKDSAVKSAKVFR